MGHFLRLPVHYHDDHGVVLLVRDHRQDEETVRIHTPSGNTTTTTTTTTTDTIVEQRTQIVMEQRGPDALLPEHHSLVDASLIDKDDDDGDDEYDDDMDPDFDPAKQIFDPTSFWTERSGRFPRKK